MCLLFFDSYIIQLVQPLASPTQNIMYSNRTISFAFDTTALASAACVACGAAQLVDEFFDFALPSRERAPPQNTQPQRHTGHTAQQQRQRGSQSTRPHRARQLDKRVRDGNNLIPLRLARGARLSTTQPASVCPPAHITHTNISYIFIAYRARASCQRVNAGGPPPLPHHCR